MKKVNIEVTNLKKCDVSIAFFHEDVWDDSFGAEQWVEDLGEAVGFIDHRPVHSFFEGNGITFKPFVDDDADRHNILFSTAKNVLRSIEFCLARVFRECEPSELSALYDDEEWTTYEDNSNVFVGLFVDYDHSKIEVSFFEK